MVQSIAFAHQDIVIKLKADGRLAGLPDQYQPAQLVIRDSTLESFGSVLLRIGEHEVELPECLSVLFHKAVRLDMSASWYHDPEVLPYYLSIDLPTKVPGRKTYGFDGWSILIALETAEIIRVQAMFQSHEGNGQRGQRIELKAFCSPEELDHLKPRRTTE